MPTCGRGEAVGNSISLQTGMLLAARRLLELRNRRNAGARDDKILAVENLLSVAAELKGNLSRAEFRGDFASSGSGRVSTA